MSRVGSFDDAIVKSRQVGVVVLLLFYEERVTRKYARLSFGMPHQDLQVHKRKEKAKVKE